MPKFKSMKEEAYKDSYDLFSFIMQNSNEYITILNEKFQIEYINEKIYLEGLGYTKEDVIGKKITDFIHPADKKLINDLNLKNSEFEKEIVRPSAEVEERVADTSIEKTVAKYFEEVKKGEFFLSFDNFYSDFYYPRQIAGFPLHVLDANLQPERLCLALHSGDIKIKQIGPSEITKYGLVDEKDFTLDIAIVPVNYSIKTSEKQGEEESKEN